MGEEQAELVRQRLERNGDPVARWMNSVGQGSRQSYRSGLKIFLQWLNRQPGWENADAEKLLIRQAEAKDQYELVDLLQKCVKELDRSRRSKEHLYGAVKSFFIHNRLPLPQDKFVIRDEECRQTVRPKLTIENLIDVIRACNLRDRSILLAKWQGLLDNKGLLFLGEKRAKEIIDQIRAKKHPVKIDMPPRKGSKDPYYTFIGKDAVDALVQYFENERGWPEDGPIWLPIKTKPGRTNTIGSSLLETLWMQALRRVGLVPKKREKQGIGHKIRWGYPLHEFRDLAKSLLHTHALPLGFDMTCSEFFLGHQIDQHGYDKFYRDTEYVRKQYLTAENALNIISNPPLSKPIQEQAQILDAQQQTIQQLREQVERLDLDLKFASFRYRVDFFRGKIRRYRAELRTQKVPQRKATEVERLARRVETIIELVGDEMEKVKTIEDAHIAAEKIRKMYDLATSYNINIGLTLRPMKSEDVKAFREWVPLRTTKEEYEAEGKRVSAEIDATERALFKPERTRTPRHNGS